MTQQQAEEVIAWMFGGDESDVSCHSVKIVKTAKPHQCMSPQIHEIPVGSQAIVERAVVDGAWCSSYVCMACAEKEAKEENLFGDQEEDEADLSKIAAWEAAQK